MRSGSVKKMGWMQIRSILLRIFAFFLAICLTVAGVLVIRNLTMSPRERTKLRLMYLIEHDGWDPFSANMSLDEYFALMELFDEGKLPLKNKATAYADGDESNGSSGPASSLYFPREKFLLSGLNLTNYKGETSLPLAYNTNNYYEPYDPNTYHGTTNIYERYIAITDEFEDENGETYILIDGTLRNKETGETYTVTDEKTHIFTSTTDETRYEFRNGVLYNTETGKVYTAKSFEMGENTYNLHEDGRLYNEKYEAQLTPYEHVLRHQQTGVIYARHHEDDLYLYDATGAKYVPGKNDDRLFTSLKTDTVYISDGKDGLFAYDPDQEGGAGDPFDEDSGDYYCINDTQLCEWRRGKLYMPETDIEYGNYADTYIKELDYYYPEGLSQFGIEYMRPPQEWLGLLIAGDTAEDPVRRIKIVQEQENTGRVAGYVIQDLFRGTPKLDEKGHVIGYENDGIQYDKYYIKQVTLDGSNVNILGIIWAEDLGKYVYYYLSAEGQSTQVSTTTLADDQKFIIEYMPYEYQVKFEVEEFNTELNRQLNVTTIVPKNVVMFGSTVATESSWVDSIFGVNRPSRTVDGAYSFDVLVPYGYEVRILIEVERDIEGGLYKNASGQEIPNAANYASEQEAKAHGAIPYTFKAVIDHTSSRETVKNTWLAAYGQYLINNKIITHANLQNADGTVNKTNLDAFINSYITETKTTDTANGSVTYSFSWKQDGDANKKVHDDVFVTIAERINDIPMHNSALTYTDATGQLHDNSQTGFPLGMFPDYSVENGSQQLPASTGPATLTFNDTFYNHFVKADRVVTAVLKPIGALMFDASRVLNTNNARNRGSVATRAWTYATEKQLVDHYESVVNYRKALIETKNPPDNIMTADNWGWNDGNLGVFAKGPMPMTKTSDSYFGRKNDDGSYNYNFFFQTNSSDSLYVDVLEINGVAIQIPLRPRYTANNYKGLQADETHPWQTTGTLPDGAKVTVEFWYGWNSGPKDQHHYRIRIEGVHTNVTISGLNLMQYDVGAVEFSVYNLVGVYSDLNGEGQQAEAIEYYGRPNQTSTEADSWHRVGESTMHVDVLNKNANDGDAQNGKANFRFKVADGYGTPYFIWDTLRKGIGFASVPVEKDVPDTTDPKDVINFSDIKEDVSKITFETNQIYYDDRAEVEGEPNAGYGYYYFRIDKSKGGNVYCGDKMALLTVVARTVKYMVRYMPEYPDEDKQEGSDIYNGFILDRASGELIPMTEDARNELGKTYHLKEGTMPTTYHNLDTCALADMLKDSEGNFPQEYQKYLDILHEYDDNGGTFYDLIYKSMATIPANEYGLIRPQDEKGNFSFMSWVVVGEDFMPVVGEDGKPIFFSSGAIDLKLYSNYAVKHSAFGNDDIDIHVLRLMPVWRADRDNVTYRVVLNWVDALGELHAEDYSELWDDIVTEKPDNGTLYVFLNQDAVALHDWIAMHPTYTFWDDVNNATTNRAIRTALQEYVGNLDLSKDDYDNILNALTQQKFYIYETDENGNRKQVEQHPHKGFKRLGADIFAVNLDDGVTISIWMYENKGGLVFHKEVAEEPFVPDDEFYFTVIDAMTGKETVRDKTGKETVNYKKALTGTYKAYPQFVYEDDGVTEREPRSSDAWLVTFDAAGDISQISKNGVVLTEHRLINGEMKEVNVKYFTLKHGEGIRLFVPDGQYTIVELGSKSGGSYQAFVEYTSSDGSATPDDWVIQDGKVWLRGKKTVEDLDKVDESSQVRVTVNFDIGEHNVVQILTFYNQTSSLSLGKTIDTMEENKSDEAAKRALELYQDVIFTLSVTLQLPLDSNPDSSQDNRTPLVGYEYDKDGNEIEGSKYYYFTANYYTGEYVLDEGASLENPVYKEIVKTVEIVFTKTDEQNNRWTATVQIKAGERFVIVMTADYDNINYWVDELDNKVAEDGSFTPIIAGYVYAKLTDYTDAAGEQMKKYVYTYYTTLEEAQAEHPDVVVYDKPFDDSEKTVNEYIQPATLAKMDLTPLISPKVGSAQKGKKDIVSVVNWLGDLPGYGYLRLSAKITKTTDAKYENGVFVFKITSARGTTLYVTVQAGQTVYIFLQCGIYTIEEIGWGWRYDNNGGTATDPLNPPKESDSGKQQKSERLSVTIAQENNSRKNAIQADYTFSPNYKGWLGGEAGKSNAFDATIDEEGSGSTD